MSKPQPQSPSVTQALGRHYADTFARHGPTSRGVDWGEREADLHLRYDRMLDVIDPDASREVSLLDVGCGYGGLLPYARSRGYQLTYTGIDVVEPMIAWAKQHITDGRFVVGDVLDTDALDADGYDYIVCNGILTQKLDTPGLEMDAFAQRLIRRMFELCRAGIAFNVMTTAVNFHSDNLYYRSPAELLSWCMAEVTRHFRIDHAYRLYEYTLYLYRQPQPTEVSP